MNKLEEKIRIVIVDFNGVYMNAVTIQASPSAFGVAGNVMF